MRESSSPHVAVSHYRFFCSIPFAIFHLVFVTMHCGVSLHFICSNSSRQSMTILLLLSSATNIRHALDFFTSSILFCQYCSKTDFFLSFQHEHDINFSSFTSFELFVAEFHFLLICLGHVFFGKIQRIDSLVIGKKL